MSDTVSTRSITENIQALQPTFTSISAAQQALKMSRRTFAMEAAADIAPITETIFEGDEAINVEKLTDIGKLGERNLLRLRKVAEVYETRLLARLPTKPLYRAALTLGKITTVGGIVIALNGVHEVATRIDTKVQVDGRRAVSDDEIDEFYFASGVFFGELVLMATPFSANFAFKATGRLHSRILWHRFNDERYRSAYRLLLHHVYYFAHGIPSVVLHSWSSIGVRLSHFVESVVYVVQRTWEVFQEPQALADILSSYPGNFWDRLRDTNVTNLLEDLGDAGEALRAHVETLLGELEEHYQNLYDEHLPEIERNELIREVIRRILGNFDR